MYLLDDTLHTFPHPSLADEDGLLAVGGDLSPSRLLTAYKYGIFPWYADDTPILWYAPHERFILHPQKIKISKSMKKILESNIFSITYNQAFDQVISACAKIERKDQDGTWIVQDMQRAYSRLHKMGIAQSIEVWQKNNLVGGLYGILIGKIFCGESMFSRVPNASKAALIFLCQHFDLKLIDCQIHSAHLESLGAEFMRQDTYLDILEQQDYNREGLQNRPQSV